MSIQLKLFCKFHSNNVVLQTSLLSHINHLVQSVIHSSSHTELSISYIDILLVPSHNFTPHDLPFIVLNIFVLSKSEIILLSNDSDIDNSLEISIIFISSVSLSAIYNTAFRAYHHFFESLSIYYN